MNTPTRTLYSPRVPRTSASSSRRSSLLPGLKKISSSKYSVSGRSNQSVQVVCKTPYHVVENFGVSLPMLVTEALTFSDRSAAVSVCISTDGWAWFVCGRRLLVWQYKQVIDVERHRPIMNSPCHELTLPPSDLAHKAELVCVFTAEGSQNPSCIAVSPEGTVRYWPSVQHEGVSVESSADLQGQECHSLTNLGPLGCVIATTTSTLLLVEPRVTPAGRHAVTCRPLRTPHGWLGLGGIGRRVSSLIFGSLPTSQIMETKLVKVVAVKGKGSSNDWFLYVLSEQSLQKWVLTPDKEKDMEHLLYECEINKMVRDAFHETVWESCAGTPAELDVWMLDMQPTEGGVMVLAAAVNTPLTPQLHYALGKIATESSEAPTKFATFCPLKNTTGFYRKEQDADVNSYQFLSLGQSAYLYNQKAILAVSSTASYNEDTDVIEFMGSGDRLLGAALCGNVPVFFSKIYGLVSVSPADISPHDLLNSSMSMSDVRSASDITISQLSETGLNITVTEAELSEFTVNKDMTTRLKAAFLHYIKNRKDHSESEQILRELFPDDSAEVNPILDSVVVRLCRDLINDAPMSDPRWADVKPGGSCIGYASLQIEHQLQDKSRALELFIVFLKDLKLWDRFTAVSTSAGIMATSYVLEDFAEKLVAAISLYRLQPEYGQLAEAVLKKVLLLREETPTGGLNYQDLFYKEVSEVHQFFQVVANWTEEIVQSDRQPQEVVMLISQINTVILAVLQEVLQCRQQKAAMFTPSTSPSPDVCEYVPWTAAPGEAGLKDSLATLQDLTLRYGARSAGEIMIRNQLYDQLVNIIDIILDGRKCQIESIRGTNKFNMMLQMYERERHEILEPFLEDEEYERAAILAEKYCDFEILIKMCEKTKNKERLEMYMDKFSEQGFGKFLLARYMQEHKYGDLLELYLQKPKPSDQQDEFSRFLKDHPSLSWVQDVFTGEFKQAGETLQQLAKREQELVRRKKSMVSLSKMALLASAFPPSMLEKDLEELNTELELILCQEDLPETVLLANGYDQERLPVLSASEIIKLYICDENETATEADFKKALDLLPYIKDEFEQSEMRHTIWCQAILRDKWDEINTDSPIDAIQQTIFFKVVDLMQFFGANPDEVLPSLGRMLESPELGTLRESNNFKYLLRVGYEYVERTTKDIQIAES
ncbi:Nuclear pore complex protein Nup133 [Gryllus bimaculatus]|nr:Nuclear pore complex protein Nup133 [Gryllus bimaculatus]